jgi:hypothetical protein
MMRIFSTTLVSHPRKYSCFRKKTKIEATNKMWLKHNLQPKASKINIVPNLHSTLISLPKMADADYILVFDKNEARIYDATTTIVSALKDPLLVALRCQDTGLWKLNLDYKVLGREYPEHSSRALMKQMPSLTSPTPNNPYYTTMHWRDSSQRKHFWLRSGRETTQRGPA